MMKKLISLLLCAVMLLGCVPFAQAETQQESGSAVDIVLLIDQSGSMWYDSANTKAVEANDPNGNRLDAAQMVIGLLGMNGSRVAYVPFAARVYDNADTSFHTINGPADYRAKMAECEALRGSVAGANDENTGGTDFAEALAYAYNLLASRRDTSNQPMIILLTDGGLEIGNSNTDGRLNKVYYVWNPRTELFDRTKDENGQLKKVNVYTKSIPNHQWYAEDLLRDATAACASKGYPVYTVALAADRNSDHYQTLRQISNDTGGESIAINKGDSSGLARLPAYFGEMFATRIGSSELKTLTAVCIDPATNLYEVKFVIPNNSVMEANLFVPGEGIGDHYMLDGENNRPSNNAVTKLSSENFDLYKLTNPRPFGIWKLRFTKTDSNASDINFNLLYNYDVVLHGYVSEDGYNRYEDGYTFQRGDTLVFTSQFFDNREGRLSTDERLYNYPEDTTDPIDDWCIMKATYEIHHVTGTTSAKVASGSMEVNGAQYYTRVALPDLKRDPEGFNGLAAGDYFMLIHVEGSGLVREVTVPFTLVNTPPAANEIRLEREVDGDDEATHLVTTLPYNVSSYVADYDQDKIISEFTQTSGHDVVKLTYDPATCTIYSTPIQREDGKLAYGEAKGELRVRESNNFGTEQTVIPVTMTVISGNNELTRRWNMRVTADGKETGSVLEKNTTFDIKLEMILAENGRVDRSETVDKVTAKIEIVDTVTNNVVSNGTMTMGADDKVFTYSFTTGNNAGNWAVTVTTYQDELPIKTGHTDFTVENEKPVANITSEAHIIYHNPLPEFLSFLGTVTPEEERTLDLTTYFTENDNEALTYILQQEPNANLLSIVQKDGVWMLVPAEGANSTTEFKVIARDNDGEATAEISFEIELVDLVQVWTRYGMMALIALVVLIILILIIRQANKPKFPKGAKLGVREGSSDYDTSSYEFPPSKKPITLAAVVMTDTAAKFGISANALTSIEIVPVRSTNYSIGVRLKKKLDDVTVSLTTKNIGKGKKPTIWAVGDALVLNSRNNTTGTDLNVVLFAPENIIIPGPGPNPIDEDPFQVNDVSGFGGFNSDVNAFGANDVSGSYGLAPTDSFGAAPAADDGGFSMPMGDSNDSGESFTSASESNDDFNIGF